MNLSGMNSMQRTLTAMSHKEPDRVPFFLPLTMHGAKELGLSIKEYFSKAENVVEGQLRLSNKYGHDCLLGFFYGPIEIQAWGGEVIYYDDGPPNSGEPFIRKQEDISSLEAPVIAESKHLREILRTISLLHEKSAGEVPILGVAISPFSVPVMQMGFEAYLELVYFEPRLFEKLMQLNMNFCAAWANAQFEAGATAITYFDPVSSPTIIPRELFLNKGFPVAVETIRRIKGPVATHLASGRTLPIIDDLVKTKTGGIGISAEEDLAELKNACRGRLTVIGNLNGLEMINWNSDQAELAVREAINKAAPGGGFVLADNHGEIPFQVSDEVLGSISEAVNKYGFYTYSKGK